jgi:hypothetical protein
MIFRKKGEGAKALAKGKYFTPFKQPAGRSLFEVQVAGRCPAPH